MIGNTGPVAGLALVGHYLKALQPVLGRLDAALPVKSGTLKTVRSDTTMGVSSYRMDAVLVEPYSAQAR